MEGAIYSSSLSKPERLWANRIDRKCLQYENQVRAALEGTGQSGSFFNSGGFAEPRFYFEKISAFVFNFTCESY